MCSIMATMTYAEKVGKHGSIFSSIAEQIWFSLAALNCLEKLRLCLQISDELRNDVVRYR